MARCNPYGWENPGGPNPAGGLLSDSHTVDDSKRWHCGEDAPHRFVWVCSHDNLPPGADMTLPQPGIGRVMIRRLPDGHRSAVPVRLCERHAHLLGERVGRQPVPCPRCVAAGPDHKCWLRLELVS
jgi:hypothetical protein